MVSAVFHSPLEATTAQVTQVAPSVAARPAAPKPAPAPAPEPRVRTPIDLRAFWMRVLPPLAGFGLLLLIWEVVAMKSTTGFPTPAATWQQAVTVFSDPFYSKGPNDQGVGWNVLSSLQRVALGFGLAALVGIPAGFAIGRFEFLARMFNPLISLLRPVSPLAWLPIGLLVFKGANPAAIWTIFICSIWPMVINTAVGVQRVPSDYMNVAKVLNLSEWKILTKILFPAVLPYMLTGVRLAVGTAWLVIVAAEMLTGGVGIGFWVWDEWNNLNVANIIIAIFVIGIVGLVLEFALIKLATAFTFEEVKS
ncbi:MULTISPECIES: nitrate ABC transporter permease [Variovorax]|jgi:nitrate/nitrite transport system permease protein|uniref:nitrate ABC transporter permease n=1 Tax=Variovorax TaxID=34072 RepID=UPI00089600D3|nr:MULTISPECIES: nitrate ABC transporter permease [Variovorax]MDQ0085415.1 nitrate/nitrite transport system permease protein [Variovorax boronicumulans]SDY89425.1 nitrate/nitrite transport system permease protein [Variovorax sp. YR634]SEU08800.1 nitrate/nitrite transport system permease protein [Variovorax sp. OV084]SOD29076.1 nitrate/nitrite transport system permease protein [Variovorax sp. YR752]